MRKKWLTLIAVAMALSGCRAPQNTGTTEPVFETETETEVQTETETETETEADPTAWTMKYFVDEFKLPTDEPFITTDCYGVFSNSVVDDEYLKVHFVVTHDYIEFALYEYGTQLVKGTGYGMYGTGYKTVILDSDNVRHEEFYVSIQNGASRFRFTSMRNSKNGKALYDLFRSNDHLAISLVNEDHPTTKYLIYLEDNTGFAEACDEMVAIYEANKDK